MVHGGNRCVIMVADGLGHGAHAADVADKARCSFMENAQHDLQKIFKGLHEALKKTRGAAILLVEMAPGNHTLRWAGVGNVEGRVLSPDTHHRLISQNGIVGFQMPTVRERSMTWPEGGILILHSDGLRNRWSLERYPGLSSRHPAIIAGILYRDYQRERDDSTVVVIKQRG